MSVQPQAVPQPPMGYRPGVINLITIISFLISGLNVLWLIVVSILILAASAMTWLAGPAVGVVGSLIGVVIVGLLLAQFGLSVLLFSAAWASLHGAPAGYSRHKLWAWIIIALDLVALLFTGGFDFAAWIRLGYAVFLIIMIDRPEVRAYFGLPNAG
ncbi:MAG: hypothetical protein U0800_24135 [Isosphaeraceae bacterium]